LNEENWFGVLSGVPGWRKRRGNACRLRCSGPRWTGGREEFRL